MAPRALWVTAHHAALPRRLHGAWDHTLNWIDTLLQRGLTDESSKVAVLLANVLGGVLAAGYSRRLVCCLPSNSLVNSQHPVCSYRRSTVRFLLQVFAAKQAVSEGSMSARNAFASAADAASSSLDSPRRDVILNEDGEPVEEAAEVSLMVAVLCIAHNFVLNRGRAEISGRESLPIRSTFGCSEAPSFSLLPPNCRSCLQSGPKEGGLEGPQAAADDAGIAVEGLDAAAAALERLTALLLFNCQGESFAWSLKVGSCTMLLLCSPPACWSGSRFSLINRSVFTK